MNNLLRRSFAGILYVAFIVLLVCYSRLSFELLQAILIVLGIVEFSHISECRNRRVLITVTDVIGGLLLLCAVNIFGITTLPGYYGPALYGVYIIARMLLELYGADEHPLPSLGHTFLGQIYIALPIALMSMLRSYGGPELVLAMFIMLWLNDTGAYCVGVTMGRHRLFERVSPKKSWEGFWGGVLLAVASAFVFKYCFGSYYPMSTGWYVGMGLIVGVFGTWGDLVESMMKRSIHVKDSGKILPGHGGILDRIDSLLLVVPTMAFYILLTRIVSGGLLGKIIELLNV